MRRERVTQPAAELGPRWGLERRPGRAQLGRVLEVLADDEHRAEHRFAAPARARRACRRLAQRRSQLDCVRAARAIADLGSGAGFPGSCSRSRCRRAHVALVESAARKCAFLERAVRRGRESPTRASCTRAPRSGATGSARHDLVVARALAPLAVALRVRGAAARASAGSLVAWKGERRRRGGRGGRARPRSCSVCGPQEAVRTAPYAGSVAHHLHVYRKVAPDAGRLSAPRRGRAQAPPRQAQAERRATAAARPARVTARRARRPASIRRRGPLACRGDDVRDRQPEGRRGQDDDRRQPRRLHRRRRDADAARRPRPAVQRDRLARPAADAAAQRYDVLCGASRPRRRSTRRRSTCCR